MNKIENSDNKKNIIKSTTYSLLNNYFILFYSLIIAFLMAKIISKELWGYLILTISFISIISIILTLLPPGLSISINQDIPKYRRLKKYTMMKSIIKNAIYIKIILIILVFFITQFFFYYFKNFFEYSLKNYYYLLILLSPLIIIISFESTLTAINMGFNNFKLIFILMSIKNIFNICVLLFYIFFSGSIEIEEICLIILFSYLIPFIINLVINIRRILKIECTNEEQITFKNYCQKIVGYSRNVGFGIFFAELWKQLEYQVVGFFSESSKWVTAYNITQDYKNIGQSASASLTYPLLTSFSSRDFKKDNLQIKNTYQIILKYSLFLSLLITGFLYFFARFFLILIYGESYLEFLPLLIIIIFYVMFTGLNSSFDALIVMERYVKYNSPIRIVFILIRIFFFVSLLLLYGLIGAIIGLVISNLITFILQIFFSFHIFKVRIDLMKILSQYLIFFIAFLASQIFGYIFLNKINEIIISALNLKLISSIPILTFLMFIFIFLLLQLFFKIFTYEDLKLFESLLNKNTIFFKIILKFIKFGKKIKLIKTL